jgi:dienelactone hydrolase
VNENGWYVQATLALIERLKAAEGLSIDPDRIYYSGFSFGGKACWEFLKAGRETFAAAACGAGWPVGRAFSDPAGAILDRLKLEVQRYKHVPVYIFAGQKDRMRLGSAAVHKAILAAGGTSVYDEIPEADHVASHRGWLNRERITWLFSQSRKNNPAPGPDPWPGGKYPSPQADPK